MNFSMKIDFSVEFVHSEPKTILELDMTSHYTLLQNDGLTQEKCYYFMKLHWKIAYTCSRL